jgi:hypothetical protein
MPCPLVIYASVKVPTIKDDIKHFVLSHVAPTPT